MKRTDKQDGYVALIAVLITAAIATATSLTVIDVATYRAKALTGEQQATQARELASGCAEEALQVLNDTPSFTGTGTFTLNGNLCTYTVTSTGASTRTLLAVATVGNSTKKLQAYVTIGTSTISITSWQEAV